MKIKGKKDDISAKELVDEFMNDNTENEDADDSNLMYGAEVKEEEDDTDFSLYATDEEEKDEDAELLKHIENSANDEVYSRDLRPTQMTSMLGGTECVITKCNVKTDNKKLGSRVTELKTRVFELTRELEQFKNAELNKIDSGQKEQLLINAVRQPFVQSLKKQNLKLEQDNIMQKNHINNLMKEIRKLTEEKKEYLTRHELDKNYFLQKQKLRDAENQFNILVNRQNEVKLKMSDIELKFNKLVDAYNSKVDEYKHIHKQIDTMKVIVNKGFKLEKVSDPIFEKKRSVISRLFRRNKHGE